jgi:hypothetical protein
MPIPEDTTGINMTEVIRNAFAQIDPWSAGYLREQLLGRLRWESPFTADGIDAILSSYGLKHRPQTVAIVHTERPSSSLPPPPPPPQTGNEARANFENQKTWQDRQDEERAKVTVAQHDRNLRELMAGRK